MSYILGSAAILGGTVLSGRNSTAARFRICSLRQHVSEALNSNSSVYRFLCLFKIIEGIRVRRLRLGKEAAGDRKKCVRPMELSFLTMIRARRHG